LQNFVKKHIEDILEKEIVLEKPKDISLGHFATPVAFSLAKEFRKSPMVIAEELAQKFADSDIFEKVESVKGFINFTLAKSFLQKMVDEALTLGLDYAKGENKNEKILLEYVSGRKCKGIY